MYVAKRLWLTTVTANQNRDDAFSVTAGKLPSAKELLTRVINVLAVALESAFILTPAFCAIYGRASSLFRQMQ